MIPARTTLTILLLLTGALLAAPGSASAQPACGDTITEDTTLTADLICDYGGLLIGADGVTLDLDGHLVAGEDRWFGPGIDVTGHSDVTIKNGRTSRVMLVDTTDSRLAGLEAYYFGLSRSERNRITDSVGGISLSESNDNVIDHNTAAREGGGVRLEGSDGNLVRRNTLCGGMGNPLVVGDGSDANLIKDNVAPHCSGLSGDGFVVQEHTAGNRLIGNTVLGSPGHGEPGFFIPQGDGIRVESPATTLIGNTANSNDDYGIEAVAGVRSGVNYARGNGNPLQCLNVECRVGRLHAR